MDVEIIREPGLKGPGRFDATEVLNKQPGFRYRLVHRHSHRRAQMERKGYEVVQGNMPERLTVTSSTPLKQGESAATTREFHDLILMRIKEDVHREVIAKPTQELQRRRAGLAERRFLRETAGPSGERLGFESTDKPDRSYTGSMDQEQFDKKNK